MWMCDFFQNRHCRCWSTFWKSTGGGGGGSGGELEFVLNDWRLAGVWAGLMTPAGNTEGVTRGYSQTINVGGGANYWGLMTHHPCTLLENMRCFTSKLAWKWNLKQYPYPAFFTYRFKCCFCPWIFLRVRSLRAGLGIRSFAQNHPF